MNAGLNAAIFYAGMAALVAGVMRALRASVEFRTRDRLGIGLAAVGLLGLMVAAIAFVTGPRTVLPF